MMNFVALLESTQNRYGVLHTGFTHHHRLESALESGILLDVFPILIQGRRPDGAQLPSCKLRFQKIRGVHRSLSRPSSDDGVQLINEKNDLPLAGSDLLEEGFEAILELPTKFGASNHGTNIHSNEPFVFEGFGHIAAHDAASKSLDNRGLAHTGLTNKNGVVFGSTGEDLHRAADFLITTDHGVNFAILCKRGEIATIFLECLVFSFGIRIGDALISSHRSQCRHQTLLGHSAFLEHL